MSGPSIMSIANIDPSKITFSDVKNLDKGGKMVYMNHNKSPLYFVTPSMDLPFGVSSWEDGKFTLQLSVKTEADQQVLNKIKAIENHVIEAAFENSMGWLKKKFTSSAIVGELFSSSIQYPKNKETGEITDRYPPTIKFAIAKDCEAYLASTKEKIQVSKETITKGAHVAVIARMSAIWFVGNKFGIVCKAEQLKVSLPTTVKEYGFVVDEDDEDGNI